MLEFCGLLFSGSSDNISKLSLQQTYLEADEANLRPEKASQLRAKQPWSLTGGVKEVAPPRKNKIAQMTLLKHS